MHPRAPALVACLALAQDECDIAWVTVPVTVDAVSEGRQHVPRQAVHAQEIEVQIGPHPARPNWRVMRVAYALRPDHDARVTAALDTLFGPAPTQASEDQTGRPSPQPPNVASREQGGAR